MNEQRMKLAIGTFVLLGLLVLGVLVLLFGGMPTLFSEHERYTTILDKAEGVGPGTPVRLSGVPIGSVESVDLDPQTHKVRIVFLVRKKYPVTEDLEAVPIRSLLGDTTLDLLPRTSQSKPETLRDLGP